MRLHFYSRETEMESNSRGGAGSSSEYYAPVAGYMHWLLLFFSVGCKFETGFPRSDKLESHLDQRSRNRGYGDGQNGITTTQHPQKKQTKRIETLPLFESTCSS